MTPPQACFVLLYTSLSRHTCRNASASSTPFPLQAASDAAVGLLRKLTVRAPATSDVAAALVALYTGVSTSSTGPGAAAAPTRMTLRKHVAHLEYLARSMACMGSELRQAMAHMVLGVAPMQAGHAAREGAAPSTSVHAAGQVGAAAEVEAAQEAAAGDEAGEENAEVELAAASSLCLPVHGETTGWAGPLQAALQGEGLHFLHPKVRKCMGMEVLAKPWCMLLAWI